MFIPYVGADQRWGTTVTPNPSNEFYMSRLPYAKLIPASWFEPTLNANYAIDSGDDGYYYLGDGWLGGRINKPSDQQPGTTWCKFTQYFKTPTTATSFDGVVKVWMNDELMLDIWDSGMKDAGSTPGFTRLTFYSSSEAKEPFEHWMDDMIVYEGYVPPSGSVASFSANIAHFSADRGSTTATSTAQSGNVHIGVAGLY